MVRVWSRNQLRVIALVEHHDACRGMSLGEFAAVRHPVIPTAYRLCIGVPESQIDAPRGH